MQIQHAVMTERPSLLEYIAKRPQREEGILTCLLFTLLLQSLLQSYPNSFRMIMMMANFNYNSVQECAKQKFVLFTTICFIDSNLLYLQKCSIDNDLCYYQRFILLTTICFINKYLFY